MNGGKVYYTLNNYINNDVIKIIQKYLISIKNYNIVYIIEIYRITSNNLPKFSLLEKIKACSMYLPTNEQYDELNN